MPLPCHTWSVSVVCGGTLGCMYPLSPSGCPVQALKNFLHYFREQAPQSDLTHSSSRGEERQDRIRESSSSLHSSSRNTPTVIMERHVAFITQMSVFKPVHHMHDYPLYKEEPTKKLFNYFQVKLLLKITDPWKTLLVLDIFN